MNEESKRNIVIVMVLGVGLAIGVALGFWFGYMQFDQSDPDDLARHWIAQDQDDIDADMVEWLARSNGILAMFGEPWLENHWESLYSGIAWEYSPATRLRDRVYEVTATARIEMMLPDGIGMVHASIPWNIRVKTRHIHVLGHPQWDAATIDIQGITLSQAELPSAIYQAKHYPSYEWSSD